MTPLQRKLQEHMTTFVNGLMVVDIIDHLVSGVYPVLSMNEKERIETKEYRKGAQQLMDILIRKDDKNIILFKEILDENNYRSLAELLELSTELVTQEAI